MFAGAFAQGHFTKTHHRRGVAATEFVVVLPLIIVLCVVAVDLGRFAFAAIALDNAARAGAERGATKQFTPITYATWKSDVEARVEEDLADVNADLVASTVTTVTTTPTDTSLPWITVRCEGNFRTLMDWKFLPTQIPIQRQTTMRQFR